MPASPEFWTQQWLEHINRDTFSDALMLMVAHSSSLEDMMPEQRAGLWSDWCLERGFEFVEADMETSVAAVDAGRRGEARSLLEQEDLSEGDAAERERGKQRLLEALHSHMWSSMTRKQQQQQQGGGVRPARDDDDDDDERQAERDDSDNDKQHYVDFEQYAQMIQQAEKEHELTSMDAFERALGSAREMREHAMSLPDEERRELAAKFALHLLSLMDGMEGGDAADDDE